MIPDDIIERAARAEFEADQQPENLFTWEQALTVVRQAYVNRVTAALAVLESAIRAQVVDEIADAVKAAGEDPLSNLAWMYPDEAVRIIRDCAAKAASR